ncbi:hypothetical protein LCGC14_1468230 [marine sediment metagenome]|uniref:Uncharacterized protein n=1 Tax=marine sediment metagenome TaxID=412755 RepID=A0A0F9MEZ3_9ZZZZ
MNLVKLLTVLVIFFGLCFFAYIVVEKNEAKQDKIDQSRRIETLEYQKGILDHAISILPKEQRNQTWVAGVLAKYPNEDPNNMVKLLQVKKGI